ncbi:Fanconi anemia group I protein [Chelonus insularis]|uniref:Fanconi anemia group I protein n=1 Tax=Chelonus insularis TaxID=460826 RepID=UPI00158BE720|nr:Fanconi anemia group I protein [Chelonus insularis]
MKTPDKSSIYSRLKELIKKDDKDGVRSLIRDATVNELMELILPRIGHDNAPKILDMVLTYIPTSEVGQTNRRKLVEALLNKIIESDVTGSYVAVLVNRIIEDFSKYSKLQLVKLVDYCLNSIRDNNDQFFCWKEILPILLQNLEDEKFINYKGSEVTGTEYKSLIIKSICNHPWDGGILTPLTQMFAEIMMQPADHGTVIRAICDKISEINHNELPPLVHQLLKLSNNQDGRLVINTLTEFFSNVYSLASKESPTAYDMDSIGQINLKEVKDAESTVLYHIRQSVLLNHSSLKDFLRHLKNITNAPEFILDPFPMSVLLLVSDIYEDQVFDIIKHALIRKIQDDERRKAATWLKEILPRPCEAMDNFNKVIENSYEDRHLVLKGLVELSFVLLEAKIKDVDDKLLHDIGLKIIQKLIKKRHEIGATVLQHLTNKIIASGASVSQYTDCLSYMCRKSTLTVLDSQVWISTLLEQLLAIPGEAASQVLAATLPLIKLSANIRDTLVLILRKALFRKGIQTRQMAVTGFLQFLMDLKIAPFSLSQSSSNTSTSTSGSIYTQATVEKTTPHTRSNPRQNSAFCLEILSILTRCLSHEVEIKQHLYKGLDDAVSSNPELAEHIIDMLLTRLNTYYEADENIKPPLKFDQCCNINGPEAILQEPIGNLIFALQKIYCHVADKDLPCIDQLSMVLESLSKRMSHLKLEDIDLDDHIDLMDNWPKSQQKVLTLQLSISVCETLIAYKINSWSPDNDNVAQSVNSLFKTYNDQVEFSKKVNKPKKVEPKNKKDKNDSTFKKPRGRPMSIKIFPTLMDVQTLKKMISLLFEPSVPWSTEDQASILKKRTEFHSYTLRTCIQVFHRVKNLWNYERRKHCKKYIKDYIEIGQVLYHNTIVGLDTVRALDEEIAVLCLECFKELCDLMCTVFSSELPIFLSKVCDVEVSEDIGNHLCKLISSLQTHIDTHYAEELEENEGTKKIPLVLFEIISTLAHKALLTSVKMNKLFEWLKTMAKSDKIDAPVAVIILQLIIMIEDRDAEYGKILDEMSLELCKKFGTIDNSDPPITEIYKILNDSTLLQAHTVFNNSLKNKMNNAAWALGRLKAEQIVINTSFMTNEMLREKMKEKERCLCKQLSYTIQTQEYLANAIINPGPNTEQTFKNLQQLYNIINTLTKHFSNKSTAQNPAFQAVKFIQVIQLAGKSLKTTFYNLITFTEEHQSSGRKTDVQALRNKVLKETKFIPKVVYEVEQFNKEILALGKKTGIPLESHIKHSITRDFRIKQPELVEGLERLDITQMMTQTQQQSSQRHLPLDETREETTEIDSDLIEESPPSKRARRDSSSSSV